jgi:hypothetical protein
VELDHIEGDLTPDGVDMICLWVNEQANQPHASSRTDRKRSGLLHHYIAGTFAEKDKPDVASPARDRGIERIGRGNAADFCLDGHMVWIGIMLGALQRRVDGSCGGVWVFSLGNGPADHEDRCARIKRLARRHHALLVASRTARRAHAGHNEKAVGPKGLCGRNLIPRTDNAVETSLFCQERKPRDLIMTVPLVADRRKITLV